jgi:hypothetical protein
MMVLSGGEKTGSCAATSVEVDIIAQRPMPCKSTALGDEGGAGWPEQKAPVQVGAREGTSGNGCTVDPRNGWAMSPRATIVARAERWARPRTS